MRTTDKPFTEALRELMEERGWSMRQLSRHTKDETGWGALSTIHLLVHGHLNPGPEAIEKIAAVFRVPPDYFAEYRLAKARDSLDPDVVGFEKALRNLERFHEPAATR